MNAVNATTEADVRRQTPTKFRKSVAQVTHNRWIRYPTGGSGNGNGVVPTKVDAPSPASTNPTKNPTTDRTTTAVEAAPRHAVSVGSTDTAIYIRAAPATTALAAKALPIAVPAPWEDRGNGSEDSGGQQNGQRREQCPQCRDEPVPKSLDLRGRVRG